jgi:hypothetical protein
MWIRVALSNALAPSLWTTFLLKMMVIYIVVLE